MALVQVTGVADDDLAALISALTLPADTKARVKQSIDRLASFPLVGQELQGKWSGLRCLGGPWRWMLVVYEYDAGTDTVTVLTIQDARSSAAAKND